MSDHHTTTDSVDRRRSLFNRWPMQSLAIVVACAVAVPVVVFADGSSPRSAPIDPGSSVPAEEPTPTEPAITAGPVDSPPPDAPPAELPPPELPPVEPPPAEVPPTEPPSVEETAPVVDQPVVSPAEEATMRADVDAYLAEVLVVVEDYEATLAPDAPSSMTGTDYAGAVESARAMLGELDGVEVQAVHELLAMPSWAEQPERLQHAIDVSPFNDSTGASGPDGLRSTGALPRAAGDPAGILSDCQAPRLDQRALFYSYWAAAQVAGAAGAVASGLPDELLYWPLLVAAGVYFGIANGLAIGLAHALALAGDCASALADDQRSASLPTDPSAETLENPKGYTRASTQTSVTALSAVVGGIQAQLEIIETNILGLLDRQLEVINALGLAQSSATFIQSTSANTQERTADLLARIGVPIGMNTTTANGLANTIDARMDTILQDTADFQTLSVRLAIERNLADPSLRPIGLFALPASQGGELETVREIVTVTIDDLASSGQTVGNAQQFLATGNAALAAGDYSRAYTEYAKAYQAAVR